MKAGLRYAALTAALSIVAVLMTWPLGRVPNAVVPASDDAYFSIWRLAWVAHQLPSDPRHLFDANIFHPATNTLAYSDAMLMLGVIATPLIRLGIDPGIVHNLLLLAGFVSSMLCAFALARRLTGSDPAAWLAAIIFGFAPYRIAHIGHLELQWTMWMPLSMLLVHRLFARPTLTRGVLLGLALGGQVLCSIYYGVFLACYLAIAWLALLPFADARPRIVMATAAATAPLLIVALIYGPPYLQTRAEFGERRAEEVREFSAQPADYLRVPVENRLRGNVQSGVAPDERSLFPGAVATALALVAIVAPPARMTLTYLALAAAAVDLSLGPNGVSFRLLQLVNVAGSLRSPSRFGALVLLSISMLAAMGASRAFGRYPRAAPAATLVLTLLCLGEYWSAPLPARPYDSSASEVSVWLRTHPPDTVVLELPTPTGSTLWFREIEYQLQSINHWQRLVNGYSAFPPGHFIELINELPRFPDPDVIARLRALKVRFILIHRSWYSEEEYNRVVQAAHASTSLLPVRVLGLGTSRVAIFEVAYH